DDNGIIEARGKEVKLRLMNTTKAQQEATKWQLLNIGVPLLFLLIFGFLWNWMRKRKYARA
ncbi:MAG: gliding motility-associated ABC transporter substrate-binding protein GldG, partial [Bacteroidetes bacterium]